MSAMARPGGEAIRRVVGVSLNAAIDRLVAVPRLEPGRIHRPVLRSVVPGGKAANTVRAARHLGLPGSLVAVLGGHAGAWYREAVEALGIPLFAVEVTGSDTRTCLSVLDEDAHTLTEFYEDGVTLSTAAWQEVEVALAEALAEDPEGAIVVLAGSLPPGAPPDAYRRLAVQAASVGARAVVDIGGDPFAAALGANPWLVKVNHEEAASILGLEGSEDPVAAARALVRRGAATAIVTMGVEGAILVRNDWAWRLGPVPEDALGVYSVGSGDAFTAGWLTALAAGSDTAIALRRAAAAGAASARMPGQGELDPAEVAALLTRFSVGPIEG